ncbi:hypothetical protein M427DRAFT_99336 [Gonapodya prolifera JEL478]|uniref:DUF218 domain-containing protein n=1 Tax=Gonapodya prolifera (strain JEL478) TaxID=1344416 RepID=A0A139ADD3_GONPJ|nr:hypothetical protein M427DRAFT_99336 [Gonapodya prolifera JEL478]|eukprot:KXS14780.1 hypothetical protein M427DRAFT_99336 [Gonapodya prolifera JEL478]
MTPLSDKSLQSTLSDLVLVAGHGIFNPSGLTRLRDRLSSNSTLPPPTTSELIQDPESWWLDPYQGKLDVLTFLEHLKAGVSLAAENKEALLMFSGGQSKVSSTSLSEGSSYHLISSLLGWFNLSRPSNPSEDARSSDWPIHERVVTEEHSRDSYENLLFGLCRFREVTGRYPRNVTIISYKHKAFRFTHVHRASVRFPTSRFNFVGVDHTGTLLPVVETIESEEPLLVSSGQRDGSSDLRLRFNSTYILSHAPSDLPPHELALSIMPFVVDPHGCGTATSLPAHDRDLLAARFGTDPRFRNVADNVLQEKRKLRDPALKGSMGWHGCLEMRGLMEACERSREPDGVGQDGGGWIWASEIPWDIRTIKT